MHPGATQLLPTRLPAALCAAGLACAALAALAPAGLASPAWKHTGTISLRESYDDNVYLQDAPPGPAVADAVQPRVGSLVSTLGASLSLEGGSSPSFQVSATYAPEAALYHSAHREDSLLHRTILNLSGRQGTVSWTVTNNAVWTDGDDRGPVYGGPGGAPAMGGAAVRDRRSAFAERGAFRLSATRGRWLGRATASLYYHDFRTRQTVQQGCANFIDRSEFTLGPDVGFEIRPKLHLILAGRFGRQQQFALLGADSPYDSWIRRTLVGLEGSVAPWLRLNLLAGTDARTFAPGTPAAFDRRRPAAFVDGSMNLTAGRNDALTVAARHQLQPSSSSVAVYADTWIEAAWKHTFPAGWSSTVSLRFCRGDWRAPAVRRDRITSSGLTVAKALGPRCTLEAAFSRDVAVSRIPGTAGREYTRNLCSLGLKSSL